ncbi:MAG: glutathione ABC transporter permease GsiD [Chloroflexota bacterium]|nr:MAG: glutathione ABC transporter permease GsiD [Chloroflexota bacterium]
MAQVYRLPALEATRPRPPSVRHRLLRDRLTALGLIFLLALGLLALLAPLVARADPIAIDPANKYQPPNADFPLGADNLGRSIWARLVYGARITLSMAGLAMAAILAIGVSVGVLAGLSGGWVDDLLMRIVDILLAFPTLILALAIAGMLGPGLGNVLIALVAVGWVNYARVARGLVLSVKEKDYVEAARALGVTSGWLALRHVLPNIISPVVVLASLDMGNLLLSISAFSFLGLGAQAPTPEWGRMLDDARPFIQTQPQLMIYPGLAVFLTVLAFNLVGDGLRDALDPRSG